MTIIPPQGPQPPAPDSPAAPLAPPSSPFEHAEAHARALSAHATVPGAGGHIFSTPQTAPLHGPARVGAPRKLPTGAVVGLIAAGVLALMIVATGAVVIPIITRTVSGPPAASPSDAAEFVEGYLQALADGDAQAAKEYLDLSGYYDSTLLADEVLAASLEHGAITDITTGEPTTNEYDDTVVPTTFTIGGEEVSRTFEVWTSYDGTLSLYDGYVRVTPYGFDDIGLTVNGVDAPESFVLFPGTYEFETDSEYFSVGGDPLLTLIDDEDAARDPEPVLNDEGQSEFHELVETSLRECVASTALTTPCGLDVTDRDGLTAVDGTVTRSLTAQGESALAALKGEIGLNSVVTAYEYIEVDITAEGRSTSGDSERFDAWGFDLFVPSVDFAAETPIVVWEEF